MKKRMTKYAVLIIKIVTIVSCFLVVGYLIVNKVFRLNADWAYSIFFVLSALLVVDTISSAFSNANVWRRTRNVRSKIMAVVFLTIFLIIAYLPASQGISERWINGLFFILALLIVIPFWFIEKARKDKSAIV